MLSEKHTESNKKDQIGIMVCIPTYNAESTISEAVKRCKEFADLVLVVDDGSTDNSESVSREAGAEILSHKINHGYVSDSDNLLIHNQTILTSYSIFQFDPLIKP